MTSISRAETIQCIRTLKHCHADTGFMHESFWKDDPKRFSRPWFAWANTIFGELIVMLDQKHPDILRRTIF